MGYNPNISSLWVGYIPFIGDPMLVSGMVYIGIRFGAGFLKKTSPPKIHAPLRRVR